MTPRRVLLPTLILVLVPLAATAQTSPLGTPIPGKPLGKTVGDAGSSNVFLANQLTYERVARAREARDAELRTVFEEKGLEYPASQLYMRVFKHERIMEVWARDSRSDAFTLVREYPVCALPGQLGPKRKMGDVQVPEGFYFIDQFNPRSNYHLSLRVSYPNLADRMRRQALSLGGDIFVHGGCETVGCVPIENENIEEVYWLAVQAMDAGQRVIPIHIFPARLDSANLDWLERTFQPEADLLAFWENLSEGFAYFEATQRVPWVTVDEAGRYAVPPLEMAGPALASPADTAAPDSALGGMAADSLAGPAVGPVPQDTTLVDSAKVAPPADSSGVSGG
jgi:murein L,D-transpeptidase YafK